MRKRRFSFPWTKYLSGLLIFALLFSQTIRMDFFMQVEAKPEQYRDIVSIFVDTNTYAKARSKVTRYAEDIQGYLGSTRVSLFVVDKGTSPVQIATKNEKLYHEGDGGSGISRLVGTVLIGDISIPMVSDDGSYFPSVYPYVDFVDKAFVYNSRSHVYEVPPDVSRKATEAEIWHGVINPAVGRDWDENQDINKISSFLDKTHAFYTKSGKFAPSTIPPRVFYYDGEYESQSVNFRSLFQYALSIQNAENIAYERFTKYLLSDINRTLLQFDAAQDREYNDFVTSLGLSAGGNGFDQATIDGMQDIHTKNPILSMLKDFQSIINKNTLSDALANVHNAGRYNNETNVRVDIAPLQMTIMDEIARSTLRKANDAIMESIDKNIGDAGMAKKIPIFDTISSSGTTYDNYFFGQKSTTITKPEQCTIVRGSSTTTTQFGRDVRVEANAGYNVNLTEAQADKLKVDTESLVALHRSASYACFDASTGKPKINSYWGGNSLLRVVGLANPENIMKDPPDATFLIKGFSEPVFSLGGMIESSRLPTGSIADCIDSRYQYALKAPYTYTYSVDIQGETSTTYTCTAGYPKEWNLPSGLCPEEIGSRTPRYTCLTEHDVRSTIPTWSESFANYQTRACYAGSLTLDGAVAISANRKCVSTVGTGEDSYSVDDTVYEDTKFHTIPSLMRHISPTDPEIDAAEANGVTPSLPVDMIRYLEFLTPKGNIARINYPNFFEAPITDRAGVRAWLKTISDREWQTIINKENTTNYNSPYPTLEASLVSGSIPASPIDWNAMISDESVDMILRARNWLTPDVTSKYKKSIETNLSYSHEYPGLTASKQPPKYPIKSDGYEIAYLGLAPFIPASSENIDADISNIQQDYNLRMSELRGLNISEPYDGGVNNPYANSDKCGPPEGVDIFQWPAAIMCWISSLLPPRIIAGSCGSNTIGMDSSSSAPLISPPAGYSSDTEQTKNFYEGGKLTYNVERTGIALRDTLETNFTYTKDASRLSLPSGSQIKLDIISLKDGLGNPVPDYLRDAYLNIAPRIVETTDAGGKFLVNSQDKKATIELRATLRIALPGGAVLEKSSDILTLQINSEYLKVVPKNASTVTSIIDATETSSITFDSIILDGSGTTSSPQFPLKLTVFDDVTGDVVGSGIVIPSPLYTLPETYTKKVGVYRLLFRDSLGRSGETSLAVRAGALAKIVLDPVSTMIRKGSNTLAIIRLQDRLGNQISPDLTRITIGVTGGYMSDANGEKKTTMNIDAMESDIPVLIGSDSVGTINITISTDAGIGTNSSLRVLETIRAVISRSTNPQVGTGPVNVSLSILDGAGNVLDGFSSVASLDLPESAGTFSKEVISIKNGVTENFQFTPGTRSGVHKLRLDIPGVGTMTDVDFSLLPGSPFYITHVLKSDKIVFALNDRYGNVSNANLTGTLKYNTEDPINISFQNGIYAMTEKSGYFTVNVPSIATSIISYTDASGNHTLSGMPFYATYIEGTRERFDFLPDYNARYTVLYGDSYLREGEDILYNSDSATSQSIAVTTLLDSPFLQDTLLTVTPGGRIILSNSSDTSILEPSVSLENGYPAVTIQDSVAQRNIAHILYRLDGARLSLCHDVCEIGSGPSVSLNPNSDLGFTGSTHNSSDKIFLENGGTEFLSVDRSGKITLTPGTTLHLLENGDSEGLILDIQSGGETIGILTYITDSTKSVILSDAPDATTKNTPIIDGGSSLSPKKFSPNNLSAQVFGYSFIEQSSGTKTIDDKEMGPGGIDSFGITHDSPGVGWKGNNRTLLSYAAGDAVGEATKWFHTYTMVNMGDPVAHVDHMAPGTTKEGIDRTIGTQITSNLSSGVSSYAHRDMDRDGYEDLITLDRDGYMNLLLNMGSRFRPREEIAYVPDLVERGMSLGDFRGDGYADIIGLDNSGSLTYIDNTERRFARMDIKVTGSTSPIGVTDFKIYDMDADGRDDIVYMNEGGELAILYGTLQAGIFAKNLLDNSLGITLSSVPETVGGAVFVEGIPQIPADTFGVSTSSGAEIDDSVLQSEVYYQHSRILPSSPSTTDTSDLSVIQRAFSGELSSAEGSSQGSITETYVKSQYAPAYSLEISRTWKNLSNAFLHAGDRILSEVSLKNTGTTTLRNIKYLDTIPSIFDATSTQSYEVILGDSKLTRTFERLSIGQFDAEFEGRDIPPGQTLTFRYELRSLPARHGEMIVGNLEGGESGADQYGDVGFKAAISCGADMLLWRSGPGSRDYTRGTRTFSEADIPDSIRNRITDSDKNNIPDSMENLTNAQLKEQYKELSISSTNSSQSLLKANINTDSNSIELGFDDSAVANIESMMQDFFDGLSCGFGGGSCMSFPINWAPLAPGGAPSLLGFPIFPMIPELGIPMFSGITGVPIYGPWGCIPVPATYPPSPLGYTTTCTANIPGAGATLGTWDPTNAVRIYATPTLTLGVGGALCFGGPAGLIGRIPGPFWGLIKGGNCVVMAKPMPFCKGDGSGSDGDVRGISGLGSITDTWNSGSCKIQAQTSNAQRTEDRQITTSIVDYLRAPNKTKQTAIYNNISQRSGRTITTGPAIRIGGGSSGGTEIGIEIDTSKPFTLGNIVKVKNGRVPAFPGFIMNWVTRQVDEMVNALFTAPSLVVIWPGVIGANLQFDGDWKNLQQKFTSAYSSATVDNLKTQMGQSYSNTDVVSSLVNKGGGQSGLAKDFKNWQNKALSGNTGQAINKAAGGLASVRAAYKMIGQLPLINIRRTTVPIDVPWILPAELDKYIKALENYQKEYNRMLDNWCANKTPAECANAKISLGTGGFMGSVMQNLSRIQEYKNFPIKLQKYVTWKQRYMSQILCNVETVRQVLGGWIKDNGIRFRKWAELFVLIKAIAESWQPLIDLFSDTSKECGVCKNQRYSTLDWKMKILSAIIPSPPIIKFPRWPDIVLDLSDIHLGINISVPDFQFNVKPLRLPDLPQLSLPNSPTLAFSLPALPILPAIPKLPDLPDLPSLPRLALPNLPPPPKIPKLLGSIAAVIKVFKLLSKIYCFLNSTFLVPEDQVGDVIAHKTERQGKFSLDFLGIQFPNFTLPSIREIRVSTHVNFELRSDFITEFARQAVKPINEFTTDLGRGIPKKIVPDVNISTPSTINLTPRSELMTTSGAYLATLQDMQDLFDREGKILLDTDEFKEHIISEYKLSGLSPSYKDTLEKELKKSRKESDLLTETLLAKHNQKYDLLTKYVQAEYDSTAVLQNIIDMISDPAHTPLSYTEDQNIGQLVNATGDSKAQKLLEEYTALNESFIPDTREKTASSGIGQSLDRLQNRIKRFADVTGASSSASSTSDVMAGYAPSYDGIYILTPSGAQTRLFDYTDLLDSTERVDTTDIDKDGDKDYIFRLDGVLFIKYTGTPHRSENIDTTVVTLPLSSRDSLPTAPNFFHEVVSTPKNLSITFTPASPSQREWRMTFYNKYLEWDMLGLGFHDGTSAPDQVVDFYTETTPQIIGTGSYLYSSREVLRSIEQVYDRESFLLTSPKITVLKEGTNFTLSAGRKLYTGKDSVTFVSLSGTGAGNPVILAPYRSYVFRDALKARITKGIAYTFGISEEQETYTYSDDFIGMPMVHGMQLTVGNGGFVISEKSRNKDTRFPGGSHYLLRFLGSPAENYNATVSYPNSMYSARLKSLDTPDSTMSDVVLFSPQVSSDSSAPVVDFPDRIRVPVYAAQSFDLREYISEMNAYTVRIDEDIRVDANANAISDDDFTATGSQIYLAGTTLTVAPHTTLDTIEALLRVTDERGNTTFKALTVEIYAPVPQINSVTSTGWVDGGLDEKITQEPIHIFRVRPGADVEKVSPDSLLTNTEGVFMSGSFFTTSGALISLSGSRIKLSEQGVFESIPTGYTVSVIPASAVNPLRIELKDENGGLVYRQFMILPDTTKILDSTQSTNSSNALVVTPRSGYSLVGAGMSDPGIPGGSYIVDAAYKPIVAIARDGNIYTLSPEASLIYGTREGYISLGLLLSGTPIANIWYKTSFFYTVK